MPQGEGFYGRPTPSTPQRVPGNVYNPNTPAPQRYTEPVPGNIFSPNSPGTPGYSQPISQMPALAPKPATPVPPPGPTPPPAGQPGIMAGPPPAYWNPSVPGIFQAPGVTPANVAPKGYNWAQKTANTLMGGTL